MSRTAQREQARQAEPTREMVPAKQRIREIEGLIERRRDQMVALLQADAATYDRFVSIALDAIVRDQSLLNADPLSIVNSVRHAAMMGLEPTSVMGEGAIVVYRDGDGGPAKAQFQPMVRGLAKLARNSGEVTAIGCDVVCENDFFEYRSGSEPVVDHRPFIPGFSPWSDATERGAIIGAYAFVKLRSGELLPLYMSVAEIYKRRAVSKQWQRSGETSLWAKWPEEMMKKTVLRRLLVEKVPLSFRAQRALALDAEIDSVDGDPARAEIPDRPLLGARTRRRLGEGDEPAQDGAGADETAGAGTDTGTDGSGRPDGSTAVLCGATGPDDVLCELPAGHDGDHVW